jgi:TetR/AcrR family transcriptional regulator
LRRPARRSPAVDWLFAKVEEDFERRVETWQEADRPTRVRLMIRHFVHYASRHPELLRFMIQEGLSSGPRMLWLVENHLAALYLRFQQMLRDARAEKMLIAGEDAHISYAFLGAASTIFAVAAECEHVTGMDPGDEANVEAHARLVEAMLLVTK